MADDPDSGSTRRDLLATSGAMAASTLLAGCASTDDTTEEPTDDASTTTSGTPDGETTTDDSYSVSMVPVGEVEFESVPETWVANNGSWADMGVALGLEPPEGVWIPSRYHTQYYDGIDGVSVDANDMKRLFGDSGLGKEQFYALDADVHVMDPNFVQSRGQWDESDVEEIRTQVGPMFGNSVFSRSYPWHEDYRYYDLYEAFEKLAQVFQRTERYEAFEQIHADFQANLAPAVPARGERPAVGTVWAGGDAPEQFYPYTIDEGTSFKHFRDLGFRDALANSDVKNFYESRGAIDFETLLDVDPPVLMLRGQEAKTRAEFQDTIVAFMEHHDVASELTAVQNGDVYRAGGLYQGPITNMVVTERLAKEVYGVEDDLFDRERVAAVVDGDV
jgi:iron complex transport system substrate-binding protein